MSPSLAKTVAGKRILVTGGAGFIGCAIAQWLAPAAARYIVLDILHPQIHKSRVRPFTLHAAVELRIADVTVANTWDTVFNDFKPHIIIHLAAETGTGQSLTEASRHGLVNVVGTTRLTDALSKHSIPVEHILLTSSRAVYGEGAWRASDGTITYPGQRRRAQLEVAQWDFPGLSAIPSQAGRTEPRPDGQMTRDFVFIDDVVNAIAAVLACPPDTILRYWIRSTHHHCNDVTAHH